MTPAVTVIGAATSAGSHHAGQEHAPAALRAAGFVTRLARSGLDVTDLGDVVTATFTPDAVTAPARNLAEVVLVARAVADAVDGALAAGRLPVVLGGDCTISLGVMAGVLRHHPGSGLLYLDGDADLATPDTSSSGVLDAMGAAHLLGLADNDLARIGPVFPMLTQERLVQFGYDETDPDSNRSDWARELPGLVRFSGPEVRADPAGCAARALAALAAAADGAVVHFDVDTIDSRDLPLANFPHYNLGLPLSTAAGLLPGFYAQPHLRAAVFTEVNPSYEPSGTSLSRYVETVAGALAAGLTQTS
ncbi:MAG TPA: arginase family protein [Streptosporangiaceae bacterium]|nr:arginase family protein [Streptosporangiaceae bacterium]